MGLSLSSVFLQYEMGSIARVFFITSGTFAGMSLWGYTTSRDLSGFGSFLMMGLNGVAAVLEGGYNLTTLPRLVEAALEGFAAG